MIWGTCNFQSASKALAYYRKQGCDAAELARKLDAGEIRIGIPDTLPGDRLSVDRDGRFLIERKDHA